MNRSSDLSEQSNIRGRAFGLGFFSILTYTTGYVARKLLDVAIPEMTNAESGVFTKEFVGILAALLVVAYAAGQIFSGFLGDSIPAKYMVLIGLSTVGVVNIVFSFTALAWLQILCFILMGLGLSMLRGPLTKMVSESLDKDRSQFICTLIYVFSMLAPIAASGLALIFRWQNMFRYTGFFTLFIGILVFVVIAVFEKKGWITFRKSERSGLSAYKGIFRIDGVIFFMIVGGITEIAGTAIGQWRTTYFADALSLSNETAQILNMAVAILDTATPFLTLALYRLIKKREILLLRIVFPIAILSFFAMVFIPNTLPVPNILLFVLGKTAIGFAGAVLWSIFIPSLGHTGNVSSISGMIDCAGYIATAFATFVFGRLAGANWTAIILIWVGIACVGLVASCLRKQSKPE